MEESRHAISIQSPQINIGCFIDSVLIQTLTIGTPLCPTQLSASCLDTPSSVSFWLCLLPDPPQVVLHLGSTLNPEDIKEGDDVYFECNIKANPKQHKITWFHDVSMREMCLTIICFIHTETITQCYGNVATLRINDKYYSITSQIVAQLQ